MYFKKLNSVSSSYWNLRAKCLCLPCVQVHLLSVRVAQVDGDWRRGLLEDQLQMVAKLVAQLAELSLALCERDHFTLNICKFSMHGKETSCV